MKYFKLGQTVYHTVFGQGEVISINFSEKTPIQVDFGNNYKNFTNEGKDFHYNKTTLSQNPIIEIVNVPLEEEYIPFTIDSDLLGKQVVSKDKSCKGVITYQDERKIVIGNYNETYEVLLKDYTFIDGKPCGKLAN